MNGDGFDPWQNLANVLQGPDWVRKQQQIGLDQREMAMRESEAKSQNEARRILGEAQSFQTGQARENAPLAKFLSMVNSLSPGTGTSSFKGTNPQDYEKFFAPQGRAMSQTPGLDFDKMAGDYTDDAANASAMQYYHQGPDEAKKPYAAAAMMPFDLMKLKAAGDQQVRVAQAHTKPTADEHAKDREQKATGMALQNFVSSDTYGKRLPAVELIGSSVKDEKTARTVISEIGSIRSEIMRTMNDSSVIGREMGASATLTPQLKQLADQALERLRKLHEELYNKWFGPKSDYTKQGWREKIGLVEGNTDPLGNLSKSLGINPYQE